MAASAAAARTAPARAPRRPQKPGPRRTQKPLPRRARVAPGRTTLAPADRIYAGAALLPHAAVRGAGAVRDLSDSGLIMRLTRGRGWIAVLCALLGGIVALNVVSLSLTAGAGRLGLQIDQLQTQNSALRAQIAERLSASRVETAATTLGLANPDPEAITYLSARDGDAERLARLLATDTFLTEPPLPSSYPEPGTSYEAAPSGSSDTSVSTTPAPSGPTPSTSSTGGGSSGTEVSPAPSTGSTGGVGL
jgi:hypothetical protein